MHIQDALHRQPKGPRELSARKCRFQHCMERTFFDIRTNLVFEQNQFKPDVLFEVVVWKLWAEFQESAFNPERTLICCLICTK